MIMLHSSQLIQSYLFVVQIRVQNTRKKYRAVKFGKDNGRRSDGSPILSKAQIELLDKIDFVWDPWGHYIEYSGFLETNNRYSHNAKSYWD